MKKELQIQAVANGFLVREPLYGGVASSPENTHVFSDASALGAWVAEYFCGPIPASPELTPAPAPVPAPAAPQADILWPETVDDLTEGDLRRVPDVTREPWKKITDPLAQVRFGDVCETTSGGRAWAYGWAGFKAEDVGLVAIYRHPRYAPKK